MSPKALAPSRAASLAAMAADTTSPTHRMGWGARMALRMKWRRRNKVEPRVKSSHEWVFLLLLLPLLPPSSLPAMPSHQRAPRFPSVLAVVWKDSG